MVLADKVVADPGRRDRYVTRLCAEPAIKVLAQLIFFRRKELGEMQVLQIVWMIDRRDIRHERRLNREMHHIELFAPEFDWWLGELEVTPPKPTDESKQSFQQWIAFLRILEQPVFPFSLGRRDAKDAGVLSNEWSQPGVFSLVREERVLLVPIIKTGETAREPDYNCLDAAMLSRMQARIDADAQGARGSPRGHRLRRMQVIATGLNGRFGDGIISSDSISNRSANSAR